MLHYYLHLSQELSQESSLAASEVSSLAAFCTDTSGITFSYNKVSQTSWL